MKKLITALMLALTLTVVGCQSDDTISKEEKIEKSNEIMQLEEIEVTEENQETIEELAEEEEILYSYIKSDEKRVNLNIKFAEDVEEEEREKLVKKYISKLEKKYEGKDIKVNIIPAGQDTVEIEEEESISYDHDGVYLSEDVYVLTFPEGNASGVNKLMINGQEIEFVVLDDDKVEVFVDREMAIEKVEIMLEDKLIEVIKKD